MFHVWKMNMSYIKIESSSTSWACANICVQVSLCLCVLNELSKKVYIWPQNWVQYPSFLESKEDSIG